MVLTLDVLLHEAGKNIRGKKKPIKCALLRIILEIRGSFCTCLTQSLMLDFVDYHHLQRFQDNSNSWVFLPAEEIIAVALDYSLQSYLQEYLDKTTK